MTCIIDSAILLYRNFQRKLVVELILTLLVSSLGFVSTSCLFAQHLNFQTIDLEDGLSDNQDNRHVFRDSKGFVWISTVDGLNRFDGHKIQAYGLESGMVDLNVQSNFFEDQRNNIWFSTYERLNCYVREKDSILTFQVEDLDERLVAEDYIAFHFDNTEQRLWFRAGDYIWGLDAENPAKYVKLSEKTTGFQFSTSTDTNDRLDKIVAAPWWYGQGVDIFYLQDTSLLSHRRLLSEYSNIRKGISLNDSIWFVFSQDKFFLVNDKEGGAEIGLNSRNLRVYDAVTYDDDRVLFSAEGRGLVLYNWKEEEVEDNWLNSEEERYSLSENSPSSLNRTAGDFLWISQQHIGLDYSYLQHNSFVNGLEEAFLENQEVVTIHKNGRGEIYIGTENGQLAHLSNTGDLINTVNYPDFYDIDASTWSFLPVEDAVLWSSSSGIYQVGESTDKRIHKIPTPKEMSFRKLCEVFPNRVFALSNKGINELVKNSQGDYELESIPEFVNDTSFTFVNFFQTSKNRLYLTYRSSELWVYDARNEGLDLIKKVKCNLDIYSFFESRQEANTVWAGTNKGLVKIINDTIVVPATDEAQPLSSGNTYGVVEDQEGDLWVGTNQGLWRYSPNSQEDEFVHFQQIDGLSSDVFVMNTNQHLAENGELIMGTASGPIRFHPSEIKVPDIPVQCYLSKFIINDTKEVKGIGEKQYIRLPYDENTLTFEALSLCLLKPKESKIHYRLLGYQDEWLEISPEQRIRYTKIPHGSYQLQIKAENAYGRESETHCLEIEIDAPFWKTWWFIGLCFLLATFMAYVFYRYRLKQLLYEEEKKTAIAQLETQVLEVEMKALKAQMNPHFLFNAMNSIKGIIVDKEEEKAAEYLTRFSLLLRTILANSEKPLVALAKELEALELYISIEALRFDRDFNYRILVDETVDTSFSEVPPMILQPFVENAIWHGLLPKTTGPLLLTVRIKREEDFIVAEIEDNGVGRKAARARTKPKDQKSMGIGITQKRATLLHEQNEIKIIDLKHPSGEVLGTNVVLRLYDPE